MVQRHADVASRLRRPVEHAVEAADGAAEHVSEKAKDVKQQYARGEDRPLGGYLVLIAVYVATVAVAAVLLRRRRTALPDGLRWIDLTVGALATFRLSRLVTKDSITSPLRAPFTRYAGLSGPAELREEVTGRGVAHAVGELLTCPFCMAQWVATALAIGTLVAPRATRLCAGVLATVGLADILHLAYGKLDA